VSAAQATILIVDDEAQNRRLLEALLEAAGYATTCAADAEEALASIVRRPPDLVLLDVMMPGMDGNELARVLKAGPSTASIPIIMVTANSDRAARLVSLDAGADDFLSKPVDRAELWLRVRNLLRVKSYGDLLQQQGTRLEEEVRVRTADLQRFRTAMDATADGIFLVERASMRFIEVNATACALFGYAREELLALGPGQLSPDSGVRIDDACDEIILRHAGGGAHGRMPDAAQGRLELPRRSQPAGASCRTASGSSSRSCATSPNAWKPGGRCTTWPTSTGSRTCPTAACSTRPWPPR
jgi:DNA-binding response OmpR family regulator